MWNLLHFSSFGGYTNEISLRQPSTSDCGDSVCSHHKMSCKPTSSFGAKGPLVCSSALLALVVDVLSFPVWRKETTVVSSSNYPILPVTFPIFVRVPSTSHKWSLMDSWIG